ncbi:hypothetical protein [Acetobacterium wieringae]|uniref:hypothetical protein n=1 Tax=Acetobacterium wieringae TaxID=52694 RepID=UPI0026EA1238|nr:hypothetical protein [Acetobacterium wieringae]
MLLGCVSHLAQNQTYEKTIATAWTEIRKEISGRGAASATIAIMENDSSCSFQDGNENVTLKYNNDDGTALPRNY